MNDIHPAQQGFLCLVTTTIPLPTFYEAHLGAKPPQYRYTFCNRSPRGTSFTHFSFSLFLGYCGIHVGLFFPMENFVYVYEESENEYLVQTKQSAVF